MVTLGDRRYCVELVVVIDNGNRTFEKKRLALIKIFQITMLQSCGQLRSMLRPGRGRMKNSLVEFASRRPSYLSMRSA